MASFIILDMGRYAHDRLTRRFYLVIGGNRLRARKFNRRELEPRGFYCVGRMRGYCCARNFRRTCQPRLGFDLARWKTYLIIKDHPWLGTGLGTFLSVFPAYRSGQTPAYGTWEQAHKARWICSEKGTSFTIIVILGCVAKLVATGRGMVARKRDEALPIAAFWINLLAVAHFRVDFHCKFPGSA